MALEVLIARFGLVAVFAGAGLEGETAVIAGGILAHQGLLSLPGVAIAAALGSFAADQGLFVLGRHFRDNRRVKRILDKPAAEKVLDALERHPTVFILGFRFLYGLRTVSPVAIGTSDVPQMRFLLLNGLAAILWSIVSAAVGYGLGGPLGRYFHHPKSILPLLIGTLLVVGAILFVIRMVWKIARRRASHGSAPDT